MYTNLSCKLVVRLEIQVRNNGLVNEPPTQINRQVSSVVIYAHSWFI